MDPDPEPAPGLVLVPGKDEEGKEGAGIECPCCIVEYPFVSTPSFHSLSLVNILIAGTNSM